MKNISNGISSGLVPLEISIQSGVVRGTTISLAIYIRRSIGAAELTISLIYRGIGNNLTHLINSHIINRTSFQKFLTLKNK